MQKCSVVCKEEIDVQGFVALRPGVSVLWMPLNAAKKNSKFQPAQLPVSIEGEHAKNVSKHKFKSKESIDI